jgi:hydroxymethylpyrimidine pyrophosphatase-like HAD family hydrolase
MNASRKYKAMICDIDGTLILNRRDALPSKKVIQAIKKANKLIHIGVASSRPLFEAQRIIDVFELSGLCVLWGGVTNL